MYLRHCKNYRIKTRTKNVNERKKIKKSKKNCANDIFFSHRLKITQNVAFDFFLTLAFSTNFCPFL